MESISSVLSDSNHKKDQIVSLPSTVTDKETQATITQLQSEMDSAKQKLDEKEKALGKSEEELGQAQEALLRKEMKVDTPC